MEYKYPILLLSALSTMSSLVSYRYAKETTKLLFVKAKVTV